MSDPSMPCEDCEQGLSSCCRLVYARDIEAVLPNECWVFRSARVADIQAAALRGVDLRCTSMIGGTFENGATWTEEMCCLPCRIRMVIDSTATIP